MHMNFRTIILDVINYTLNTNNCCQHVMLKISSALDTLGDHPLMIRLPLLGVIDLAKSWLPSK